jgi:hypothetical protein
MRRSTAVRICLLAAVASLASGCASGCGVNDAKLSELRRGMTYGEAAAVMGCDGRQISRASAASGDFATVEWDGPDQRVTTRTQLDFENGRLLSFTTERRYGL